MEVSKATMGILLRGRVEYIWAFLSAEIIIYNILS